MGAAIRGRDDPRIPIDDRTRVLVLSGAGISAESGLATFRGADGLWKRFRAEELATPAAFARMPEEVWAWYRWRLKALQAADAGAAVQPDVPVPTTASAAKPHARKVPGMIPARPPAWWAQS